MLSQELEQRESDSIIRAWEERSVWKLCRYYFNFTLTEEQKKIVSIVAFDGYWKGRRWVEAKRASICCVTRYGKSRCVALGCLLWIMSNPGRKLRIIAPTGPKTSIIRDYMIEHVIDSEHLMHLLDIDRAGRDRIKKAVNRQRMTWKNGVDMRTLSADKAGKGEGLMGWGGDKIVVEEAGEIPAEIWPKVQRMLLDNPNSSYIEIGNPWNRDGFFWTHWIDPTWEHIHIDWRIAVAEERFTQQQIDEIKNDPMVPPVMFQVLYEAIFPEESDDQLIPYWAIEKAARDPPKSLGPPDEKRLGGDIAEMGRDLTVLTAGGRWKSLLIAQELKWYGKKEVMETVGWIVRMDGLYKGFHEIVIDGTGLGSGVPSRLKELRKDEVITGRITKFVSAEKPRRKKDQKEFSNLKAQAYFNLRKLFIEGNIIIPKHRVLIEQLSKMKYKPDSAGRLKILDPGEGKDDTAEKKSPDFADSLMMFAWNKGFKAVIR